MCSVLRETVHGLGSRFGSRPSRKIEIYMLFKAKFIVFHRSRAFRRAWYPKFGTRGRLILEIPSFSERKKKEGERRKREENKDKEKEEEGRRTELEIPILQD